MGGELAGEYLVAEVLGYVQVGWKDGLNVW